MQWTGLWCLSGGIQVATWRWVTAAFRKTWRHMNGYSSHTYSWPERRPARCSGVKYHFKTDQEIEFPTRNPG